MFTMPGPSPGLSRLLSLGRWVPRGLPGFSIGAAAQLEGLVATMTKGMNLLASHVLYFPHSIYS